MAPSNYSFSGWATRNDLKCSDGRIIRKDAFRDQDGQTVPLVWMHTHDSPFEVLGHALLENRDQGVYAYCTLNDNEAAKEVDGLVKNGDVNALSIYANKLKQSGSNVLHGQIREVSVVLSGANPGAVIDNVIVHSDGSEEYLEDEAIIFTGDSEISLCHSDDMSEESDESTLAHANSEKEESKVADDQNTKTTEKKEDDRTIQDVIDSMSEEQKNVLNYLVGKALEENGESDEEDTEKGENTNMKHNVFEGDNSNPDTYLSHDEMTALLADAKRLGSLKAAVEEHEVEPVLQHDGIEDTRTEFPTNADFLFPEYHNLNNPPEFIRRRTEWVSIVMNGVHKTPFSRIKSQFADITGDELRAKGYIKGKYKKEDVFTLLKRTTDPYTVYKKMKMHRDDVIDITDFDVVAWIKGEMRGFLDEEIARAILFGDGRSTADEDHIPEDHIRPIWKDEDLFTIHYTVDPSTVTRWTDSNVAYTDSDKLAMAFVESGLKSRKQYRGSGNPILFTTEDILNDCLLLKDANGRYIWESVDKLASQMRVSRIVTCDEMENLTRTDGSKTKKLMGLVINLSDYNVGADKGGAVNMFDDFDIDYNQMKYLIETRCSGAITKPYSAIALESDATKTSATGA